jgi:diguanylate cyclase (GGDEF)-like protein
LGRTRWDTPAENLGPADWAAHKAVVQAHLPFYDFEIKRRIANGVERWASVSGAPIRDKQGRFLGYRGIGKDITARKKAEASVMRLAHYDTLTGLPNRAMFMERLTHQMARAHRNGAPLALMLLDIDHFKSINDSMGHDQGDQLLIQAAQRLTSCTRQSDTVARLGGDEFIVILSDIKDNQPIERAAQKILEAISAPFALAAGAGFVSASVGIAHYPSDASTIDVSAQLTTPYR